MTRGLIDRLVAVPDHNDEPSYRESEIREVATRVIELQPDNGAGRPGGLLAVVEDGEPNGLWVEVALFRFVSTNTHGPYHSALYQLVMHGEGPSGALREFRHSYWGEDGYIFYAQHALIVGALDALREWFDLD